MCPLGLVCRLLAVQRELIEGSCFLQRNNPLVRTDSSGVQVVLLSGQRVEVTCRTDAIASEIFDLVVAHTNLNEHYFFGLTVLKDGEHFFLEPHQRLSKFSPPGWKNQRKTQARNIFTLFLRLKYYPHSLEFIKTELTLHEMYLQLRRDVIDERMHANRDAAYQLAALALQAELGDRPNESTSYFHPNHYLPDRHLREEMGGEERIRSLLAELHSQYSGMSPREAEIELLKMCQAEREYGIHFHRVFRSKPSLNLGNTPLGDPETGTALWIGIMPRGIVVFEERSGTRVATSQHPWQETQTLQFDKKRFVIVGVTPKDGGEPKKTIFYTDDYKKSSYFVKFAAVQHRFMIKMRQWTATLQSDATKSRDMTSDLTAGVSVDRHANNLSTYSGKSSTDSGVPDLSREASPEEKLVPPSRTNKAKPMPAPLLIEDKPGVLNVSVPSTDRTLTELNNNDSISASFAARLDDSRATTTDGTEFDVVLSKDPQFGLGLTLVDGDLNGMKGVYVKSVTSGGPGDVQGGLRIGDRLISVNGVSLRGKNRHDTVNIVKQSESNVRMTVLRLRGLSSSAESLSSGSKPSQPPPAPPQSISKRVTDLRAAAASSRQRAVSDFGAAGDTLPTLKSEDIIADIQFRRRSNSMEKRPSSGSTSLDARQMTPAKSDSHLTAAAVKLRSNDRLPAPANHSNRSSVASTESSRSSGEYQMPKDALGARSDSPPNISSTIYGGFDPSDDSDAEATSIRAENASAARRTTTRSSSDDDADDDDAFGRAKRPNNVDPRRRDDSFTMNQLDWTDHIDIGDVSKDSDMVEEDVDEDWQEFDVTLSKNDRGGLGLQIAGGGKDKKHIYVKALVATPALTCDDIRPGDRLVSVNRLTTDGKTHQEVVELLKNATSPVTLGLARLLTRSESESDVDNVDGMQTLTVTLEKPASGSLGLSLAKLTGGVGIYVRVIAAGSVADLNGTLRVGDRLWEVNGESVADASPLEVVEKLKKAEGFVNLVFKRNKESVVS
uniref:Uncharacterized protein n=1 Tax=Plectus sambesii TaxID=2011161 RepID=A0A914XM52_9BILA